MSQFQNLNNYHQDVPVRLYKLSQGGVQISINVVPNLWPTLKQIAGDFSLSKLTESSDVVDENSGLLLHQNFMQFIVDYESSSVNQNHAISLLQSVYEQFCYNYLRKVNGIHAAASTFDEQSRNDVIRTCNLAYESLLKSDKISSSAAIPHFCSTSSLLESVKESQTSLLSIFGGQGANDVVGELRKVFNTYTIVQPYVRKLCEVLLDIVDTPEAAHISSHPHGLDVLEWISEPSAEPNEDYTLSCPVSFPVITLAQLTNYYVFLKVLNLKPSDALNLTQGMTGHSQGIIAAVCVASSLSFESFEENSCKALKLSFWMGVRIQQVYPQTTLNPGMLADSLSNNEETPTPMLAISHLPVEIVKRRVEQANSHLGDSRQIYVSLVNGPRSVVVSGHPQSLYGLHVMLRELMVKGDDPSSNRVPFSQRKQRIATKYLPVKGPFHSSYLKNVPELLKIDIEREGLHWTADLELPVFSTEDGHDLREFKDDISNELVRLISVCPVNWPRATSQKVTHVLDFGPGGLAGVGSITHRNKRGEGVRIAMLGSETSTNSDILSKLQIFSINDVGSMLAPNWGEEYAPKLVRVKGSQTLHVQTKMSKLLGKPPIMVAGMTPTTVNPSFVSACMNAGYHVELAGGGHYNEQSMRGALDEIVHSTEDGNPICINVLFLNVRQWQFQYPLIKKMRQEGYPIDGLCIAAGVPSLDNASEIVQGCRDAGLQHISFKPGSMQSIRDVLKIADAYPTFPFILQWTGGRAGGHHSFDDFHHPILYTYSEIRKRNNVILVAGSGFGDGRGALPYLTGNWSHKFQFAAMPFDGILFGSRVMVAKEAKTSDSVKEYLVKHCNGIDHSEEKNWEKSYTGIVGGVTSVLSELGEPIHKVATRGVLLWKELDELIFTLPVKEQLPVILAKKDYIIKRLNDDSQKVYFGKNSQGETIDIDRMSYAEVINRLIELLYITDKKRWVHISHQTLVLDMIVRTAHRLFAKEKPIITAKVIMTALSESDNGSIPDKVKTLIDLIARSSEQPLSSQDIHYFLSLCKRRGQKPVPFIPILDADFKMWFKKDSLWQSEDIDCVVDADVGRVCILQGPVAAFYNKIPNEPVGSILNGAYEEIKDLLSLSQEKIEEVHVLGGLKNDKAKTDIAVTVPPGVEVVSTKNVTQYTLSSNPLRLVDFDVWIEYLAEIYGKHSGECNWFSTILTSPAIMQNKKKTNNRLSHLFKPRPGQVLRIENESSNGPNVGQVKCIRLFDSKATALKTIVLADHLCGSNQGVNKKVRKNQKNFPIVEAIMDNNNVLTIFVNEPNSFQYSASQEDKDDLEKKRGYRSLELKYKYKPETGFAPLHEIMDDRIERIDDFYSKLWFDQPKQNLLDDCLLSNTLQSSETPSQICSWKYEVKREDIISFCRSIDYVNEVSVVRGVGEKTMLEAPMDFAIVIAWKAIMASLFSSGVKGDLLKLVHQSNSYHLSDNVRPFLEGDLCETDAKVVRITPMGKDLSVTIAATLQRGGKRILEITSEFLYRDCLENNREKDIQFFEKKEETPVELHLATIKELAVLKSKTWIEWEGKVDDLVKEGMTLTFKLSTEIFSCHASSFAVNSLKKIVTTGDITVKTETEEVILLGHVHYAKSTKGNKVMEYLDRHGSKKETEQFFENGGYSILPKSSTYTSTIVAPPDNKNYASASGDTNPIHVNPYISDFIDLPGTITHGMFTSAASRRLVEVFAADNEPKRVVSYKAQFLGMVLPGDKLETKLTHVGMTDGKMIINVDLINQEGRKVLHGIAHILQPTTAYVFTGQGSQEKGMGMELYKNSDHAKRIWNKADKHFMDRYGFSILDIVQNNPKEHKVYFGGVKGRKIRETYMEMSYDCVDENGDVETLPLFPSIKPNTQFYTFVHPLGLLSATQFTQPALVLYEKAAFEDMRARGLIPKGCTFAGHSLGEYAALAAFGNVLPISSLMDVVFYRGMTMQYAVKRNEDGSSNYGMMAVNPTRVDKLFTEKELQSVCETIVKVNNKRTDKSSLLEIVNHNVENWQYVVAGDLLNLQTLTYVLNYMKAAQTEIKDQMSKLGDNKEKKTQMMADMVTKCFDVVCKSVRLNPEENKEVLQSLKQNTSYNQIVLERGVATIPLPGIDVPFHSRFLLSGVTPFRTYLKKHLDTNIDMNLLINQYIPNLTARPFDITKEFYYDVLASTNSEDLKSFEHLFSDSNGSSLNARDKQDIGYCLLVELLAFQFASPVQWIKTQDEIFDIRDLERVVEVGPAATLANMAKRTLTLKYDKHDKLISRHRVVLSFEKDLQALYFDFDNEEDDEPDTPAQPQIVSSTQVQSVPTVTTAASSGPTPSSHDGVLSSEVAIRGIIALKLKKKIGDISVGSSVKELVSGKSTLQNEILGDLQNEFKIKSLPERAEEMHISELATLLQPSYTTGRFGKVLQTKAARLASTKFPAGFSLKNVHDRLQGTFGIVNGLQDAVVLQMICCEPSSRLENEAAANKLIDDCVASYGTVAGISFSAASSVSAAPQQTMAAAPQGQLSPQIEDKEMPPLEFIRTIIACKLKTTVRKVTPVATLKGLVQGKSTLQNEIIGDIQAEFGTKALANVSGPEEVPLSTLAETLTPTFGKVSKALTSRLLSSKLAAGFSISTVKEYLSGKYGFGTNLTNRALLYGVTIQPTTRLASAETSNAWLDEAASGFKATHNIQSSAATISSSVGVAVNAPQNVVMTSSETKQQRRLLEENLQSLLNYFGKDGREGFRLKETTTLELQKLQNQINEIENEHGEFYLEGIKSKFSSQKVRRYDSAWNWARQDSYTFYNMCLDLYRKYLLSENANHATSSINVNVSKLIHYLIRIKNRLTTSARTCLKQCFLSKKKHFVALSSSSPSLSNSSLATLSLHDYIYDLLLHHSGSDKNYGQLFLSLISASSSALSSTFSSPSSSSIEYNESSSSDNEEESSFIIPDNDETNRFEIIINSLAPRTTVSNDGKIIYKETERNISYLNEIQDARKQLKIEDQEDRDAVKMTGHAIIDNLKEKLISNVALSVSEKAGIESLLIQLKQTYIPASLCNEPPLIHLKRQHLSKWHYDQEMSQVLFDSMNNIQTKGLTLRNKTVLVTGCGRGSIGEAMIDGLLSAGAKVIVTSSSFNQKTTDNFRRRFESKGSSSSVLIVIPFNQASLTDVKSLVDYVYDELSFDLDFVVPFAAISEGGRMIDNIDDRSELAHRLMMTNIVRLLGYIKIKKEKSGSDSRPSVVILPLSPNHGVFGGDGLYAESKIGLETLFNKWRSEDWAQYITLIGAEIGWTRGTGLMSANNIVAEGVEELGVRTFSTQEMAFNLLSLMDQHIVDITIENPVWADFTGGMDKIEGLDKALAGLRKNLQQDASTRQAVKYDADEDRKVETGTQKIEKPEEPENLANIKIDFPKVKSFENLSSELGYLRGTINLEETIVVTGYGEVGPWGNARTRWEMEAYGEFSLEGCIEMAWIMGFIKHFNGILPTNNKQYSGWIDTATKKPIKDSEVKAKYEEKILEHTGIRFIEPELFDGYDPNKKQFIQQVAINNDMGPIECSEEEALEYKREHGDNVDIYRINENGDSDVEGWCVVFKRGAQLFLPKALKFSRLVAGQIPTGWDATRYGIPEDIKDQVDPVTLFNLVSTVEALVHSGMTDPYEFYEYVHVSEVGNTTGGGVGGMKANMEIYKKRFTDPAAVQGDILQESFINTMPAWVNLLLLSSSGPIKTPVGACATAVESVEIGLETILSGKAKVVIVGGYDDFQEPGSYEFAQMRATSDSIEEEKMGRSPKEMSRPCTSSRGGFMESQGAGNQILMSASLAVKMGLPIYGIIALTNTATDKEGRSIPAPGQGILTTAREVNNKKDSVSKKNGENDGSCGRNSPRLLNFEYRRRQLKYQEKKINEWMEVEIQQLQEEKGDIDQEEFNYRAKEIEDEVNRLHKTALSHWGNFFYKNNVNISPLRGALAVYGLTIDDIDVASFHGTGTKANDKNESDVLNSQLEHLGRTKGNLCPGVFQKYLTGHPKGAAAAWMLNGCLQMMQFQVIPGNRNADNIDGVLEKFNHLFFPSQTLYPSSRIKAALLKSFGFGQVGGECLVIHPDYVLSSLSESEYSSYQIKRSQRELNTYRYIHDTLCEVKPFVRVKNAPPYSEALEKQVYLNPAARASFSSLKNTWEFTVQDIQNTQDKNGNFSCFLDNSIQSQLEKRSISNSIIESAKLLSTELDMTSNKGVGIDVESLSGIPFENETFINRNFTEKEQVYCYSQPDPHASFTGKWCAKEAVIKAISNFSPEKSANKIGWKGAGAPLIDIEVLSSPSKSPEVIFHNEAKEIFAQSQAKSIKLSISHTSEYAVGIAFAF